MSPYDALTARAAWCAKTAKGEQREGRYQEAFAHREQAHADLAEATRLRKHARVFARYEALFRAEDEVAFVIPYDPTMRRDPYTLEERKMIYAYAGRLFDKYGKAGG